MMMIRLEVVFRNHVSRAAVRENGAAVGVHGGLKVICI